VGILQAETTEVDSVDPKASKAKSIFTKVSVKYPVSATAQGAMIARLCKAENLNPAELRDVLLGDDRYIEDIATKATKAHANAGKDFKLSEEQIRNVITVDFDAAIVYMDISDSTLEKLEAQYERFRKEFPDPDEREEKYIQFSNGLLDLEFSKGSVSPLLLLYGFVLLMIVVIVLILSDTINFSGPPNPDDYGKLPGGVEPAGSKLKKLIP